MIAAPSEEKSSAIAVDFGCEMRLCRYSNLVKLCSFALTNVDG
jgi:hypothetical protein